MDLLPKTRMSKPKSLRSLYFVFCLSLAFMVFAWGTNYKLSLYKAGHQHSPAKVCTRGSDASKSALDYIADVSDAGHPILNIAIHFHLLQKPENNPMNRLRDEAIIGLSPLSRAPILYLRPPPDQRVSFV